MSKISSPTAAYYANLEAQNVQQQQVPITRKNIESTLTQIVNVLTDLDTRLQKVESKVQDLRSSTDPRLF